MTITNPDESTYQIVRGFRDTAGRNPRNPHHSNRIVLGVVGQSLWCSTLPAQYGGSPYISQFPNNVFCGNPYDGLFYEARDPWLGCSNNWADDNNAGVQSFMGMLGDALYRKLGFPSDVDIIIWNVSIGGSIAAQWDPASSGTLWPRIEWLIGRANEAGAPIQIMLCGQIESECGYNANNGYIPGSPGDPALWVQHWQSAIYGTRGMGFGGPWLMPVFECWSTGDKVNTAFQAGVMPIISIAGRQWFNGNLDAINVGGRITPGNGHLNYGGNLAAGTLVANAVWGIL